MEPATPLDDLEARYVAHHRALGHSQATINRYQATFSLYHRFLADASLRQDSQSLTTEAVKRFAIWLRETPIRPIRGSTVRSPVGVHCSLKDMRAFTRWLVAEEVLDQPLKIRMPRLPQTLFPILTDEELGRVWKSRYLTGRSSMATRNRALLGLMLDTGLRRTEVSSLNVKDLELADCLLTVTGKGNKQRRVPFSTSVRVLLEEWLHVRGNEESSVFWLSSNGVRTVFRRIGDDVGLARFFPHQMRHQAASMMVRNNADLESVRRILGHSDLSTTAQYLSLSDADLRAKHAAASPFDALMRDHQEERPRKRKRLSLAEGD